MEGTRRCRVVFAPEEEADIWARWQEGESQRSIARSIGCFNNTIGRVLRRTGGIPPTPPGEYSPLRLSAVEREEISRGLAAGHSLRAVARCLGRAPSTISREVAAGGGREHYRAHEAHQSARVRARRPKVPKLVRFPTLRALVETKLGDEQWSPEQISAWLARTYPEDPTMQISAEAVYQSLYIQSRGALRKELTAALRTGRAMRRSGKSGSPERRGKLKDMVLVSERPAEVADRAVPGHWEGDLIIGQGHHSSIGTLVERTSRFVVLLHLPEGHRAELVRYALQDAVKLLPEALWRSITWDQGKELAEHAQFKVATGVQVYFCNPHSPWQRGTNENTNGLLRQYFPKHTDLSVHSPDRLQEVADKLNRRPRQTLGWLTPGEKLDQIMTAVASTG